MKLLPIDGSSVDTKLRESRDEILEKWSILKLAREWFVAEGEQRRLLDEWSKNWME